MAQLFSTGCRTVRVQRRSWPLWRPPWCRHPLTTRAHASSQARRRGPLAGLLSTTWGKTSGRLAAALRSHRLHEINAGSSSTRLLMLILNLNPDGVYYLSNCTWLLYLLYVSFLATFYFDWVFLLLVTFTFYSTTFEQKSYTCYARTSQLTMTCYILHMPPNFLCAAKTQQS